MKTGETRDAMEKEISDSAEKLLVSKVRIAIRSTEICLNLAIIQCSYSPYHFGTWWLDHQPDWVGNEGLATPNLSCIASFE